LREVPKKKCVVRDFFGSILVEEMVGFYVEFEIVIGRVILKMNLKGVT